MLDPVEETKEQIRRVSKKHKTDLNYRVFILGPYDPLSCKDLLTGCRDRLRNKYKITAFLEDDIHISFDQTKLCYELAGISELSTFIIPSNFKSDGWKTEIGQLVPMYSSKIAIYYESLRRFPITTKNLLASYQTYQSQLIEHENMQSSVEFVCNHINTILLKLHISGTSRL